MIGDRVVFYDGDRVVFYDWVDLPRLRACRISEYYAAEILRRKGTFVVKGQAESGSSFFEGPWLRVQLDSGAWCQDVYVKRCYFQLAHATEDS